MPKVNVHLLSDAEAAALRDARSYYGTYRDIAAELGIGTRTVQLWLQKKNRGAVPLRQLRDLLSLILSHDPGMYDRLRWVMTGPGNDALQLAHRRLADEREHEVLLAQAGVVIAELKAKVGAAEAKRSGHKGFAKAVTASA